MIVPPLDEVALVDAYIDARGHSAGDGRGADRAGSLDPALGRLVDRLAMLPADAWLDDLDDSSRLDDRHVRRHLGPAVRARTGAGAAPARERAPARPSAAVTAMPAGRRRALFAAAAAVVLLAAALGVVSLVGGPAGSPARTAWRLAGYLQQPEWQAITSSPLAIAPTVDCPSATECYAASTSARGAPVERTADGGTSWTASATPADFWPTSDVSCPSATTCMIAGDGDVPSGADRPAGLPEVLVTDDGGASWSTWALPAAVAQATDLDCLGPASCVVAGPATAPGGGVTSVSEATTDAGVSWDAGSLPGGFEPRLRTGLQCPSASVCVVVGSTASGEVPAAAFSSDGGRTWSTASLPTSGAVGSMGAVACGGPADCLAVAPSSGSAGAASPSPSVALVSMDGGRSWTSAGSFADSPLYLTSASCIDADSCWVAGETTGATGPSHQGVIESTGDGGGTWTDEPLPGTSTTSGGVTAGFVASLSCAAGGSCLALAGALAPATVTGDVVLTNRPAG